MPKTNTATPKPKTARKPRARSAPRAVAAPLSDLQLKILQTGMDIAAQDGWDAVTETALAQKTRLKPATIAAEITDKTTLLLWLGLLADDAMERGSPPEGTQHDQLFDLMMRRLDALMPYREGMFAVWRGVRHSPQIGLALFPSFDESISHLLHLAGAPVTMAYRLGLGAVAVATLQAWLYDASEDLSSTMAVLDKRLHQMAEALQLLGRFLPV